jgi:hypothetical protein
LSEPSYGSSRAANRLNALRNPTGERLQTLVIIAVSQASSVTKIEGDVRNVLSDWNHGASQRVSDASFIEDIGIHFCEVADD